MTSVDLKKWIYENKKIPDILADLGCGHVQYHNKGYWSCSNPDGDNVSAVNIDNTQYLNYINWTRGVSGSDHEDIIDLVESVKGYDFIDAVKYLHKLFNIPLTYRNKRPVKKQRIDPLLVFKKYIHKDYADVSEVRAIPESTLNQFAPYEHISFYKEEIMPYAAVKRFGLCYDYERHRQIIPIRSIYGELMGYNARSTIPNCQDLGIPKYLISKNLNKHLTVYGLWENRNYINQSDTIVVFEAEKSVLKRASLFDNSCVALEGHAISEEQVRILIGCCKKEIVIAMDKDVSEKEVFAICDKFYGIRQISYIFDKWNIIGEKDSPCDKGNKIYQFLLKHRFSYGEMEHKKYVEMCKEKL